MKIILIILFLSIEIFSPRLIIASSEIRLSKNQDQFAKDMEFYYLNKNHEILKGLIRTLDNNKILSQGDKKLMLAAFLAEIIKESPDIKNLLLSTKNTLSRDGKRTLAWMLHLANISLSQRDFNNLLDKNDTILIKQIKNSPKNLLDWNIYNEKSILNMYWGAYFATGKNIFLDPIINAALKYAYLNSSGLQHDHKYPVSQSAAATLYEMTPRHAHIYDRVKEILATKSGVEAETLKTILHQTIQD